MLESETIPVVVTPAMARAWLEVGNPRNKMWGDHVAALATAMIDGTYHQRGAPIQFELGRLVNGHHRLQAIIISESPATLMVCGHPPK